MKSTGQPLFPSIREVIKCLNIRERKARTKTGVIIVAAGGSTRMGGIDKVKAILQGSLCLSIV
jgi:hypothetical protein